jgi:acetyltransferase-like isoleucine patch superfamily enzyme
VKGGDPEHDAQRHRGRIDDEHARQPSSTVTTRVGGPRYARYTKVVDPRQLFEFWMRRASIMRRLRSYGLASHLLGFWLRRYFQQAGVLVVRGGLPLPEIDNRGGRIEVGNCGFFSGVRLECWPGATIRIGNGTYLNRNTEIVAARRVTIGQDCKIARDVIIMDTDQHELPGSALIAKPVEIGDRVWIGSRAIILKGVSIGDDSVIGAGAVVTKSVPSRSVVVGPAAGVIRRLPPDQAPDRDEAGVVLPRLVSPRGSASSHDPER